MSEALEVSKDPRLPKAALFHIRLSRGKWMMARFRLANSHQIFLGPFSICIRAAWLEGPARKHLDMYAKPIGCDTGGNPYGPFERNQGTVGIGSASNVRREDGRS